MGLVVIPEAPKSSICSRGADRRGGDADGCEVARTGHDFWAVFRIVSLELTAEADANQDLEF